MSDTAQGPGWWQASDGRWYSPERHPNYSPARPAGTEAPATPPPRYAPRTYPTAAYAPGGSPSGGYPVAGYPPGGYPGAMYPGIRPRSTNGLAIASFVMSLLWFFGISALLAVIFGFVARRQIRVAQGAQGGDGLAIAGIVIGAVGVAGSIALWVVLGLAAKNAPNVLSIIPRIECLASGRSVESALQQYKMVNGAYPTPPGPWSAVNYPNDFTPLTTGMDRGPFLFFMPTTNNFVIEYDSSGHVWVEGPGRYDSSYSPAHDFNTSPTACDVANP